MPPSPSRPAVSALIRRTVYGLRTEGTGAGREAAAMGLGTFIGCSPFYGFHFAICWAVGWLLGLNRLKMYLASNISNPLFAPFLVMAEVQAGAWARRGPLYTFHLDTIDFRVLGFDLLVGSGIVGSIVGIVVGAVTFATLHESAADLESTEIVRRASDRYLNTSMTAWEFARGKLRGDAVYRDTLAQGLLRSGTTLLDVGCGQGLMLAFLVDARRTFADRRWPSRWPPPPEFDRLIGVERRPRMARLARQALGSAAEIVEGDARDHMPPGCDAILLFDVLQMMPAAAQEALLASLAASLQPGGVMLVREADASAGWRFHAVRTGNSLKAYVSGSWRQRFHFRSVQDWQACFASLGLDAVPQLSDNGRRANVLFRITRRTSSRL